ncbi:sodium-dependent transporter [Neoroseomonas rubea]|uniref:sodium-dependent transporter n=1 Tax=Neoroseomonas rubea TaxID=2748666 RepID=UPI0018DF1E40|nr:sodium-dependent transporter [Roseomonas rubea]
MREQWGSRSGLILAAIGAAVGLGNIWRFAYVAGENGGGAFLLAYLLIVLALGVPLVIAELAIGKRGAADAVTAFQVLAPQSVWRHAGWFGVVGAGLILSYYAVIAGWALRYFAVAATGALWDSAAGGFGDSFRQFIAHPLAPLGWQFVMMLAAMLVVAGGVGRGIERVNLWLMPLLAVIVILLAVFALSLPGSAGGVSFLFAPDWASMAKPKVVLAALGQAFFSIGVGMAVYVTYGSYMRREHSVPISAAAVVAGDTAFAFIAGLAIFPAVFAMGGDPAAGPELAFITLPQIFLAMPGGWLIGPVFFFLLSAAALTSMVSLLEVPVATAMHRFRMHRGRAVAAIGGVILLAGVPSALSFGVLDGTTLMGAPILDATDRLVSNLLLPIAGGAVAIFFGWVVPRQVGVTLAELGEGPLWRTVRWLLRYPAPALILGLMLYPLLAS